MLPDTQQRPTVSQEYTSDPNVVYQGDPNVAPAGYKRDEQMAERKDNLQEKAAKLNEQVNVGTIDPTTFAPDREIRHLISMDALYVSNKLPEYEYKWIRDTNAINGGPSQAVLKEISKSIVAHNASGKQQVYSTWEVVRENMPEAIERKNATGARQVGDTILLRCHKNAYLILQQQERQKRINQDRSVTATLEDKAYQAGAPMHNYTEAQAAGLAKSKFNQMIKTGSVPGMVV